MTIVDFFKSADWKRKIMLFLAILDKRFKYLHKYIFHEPTFMVLNYLEKPLLFGHKIGTSQNLGKTLLVIVRTHMEIWADNEFFFLLCQKEISTEKPENLCARKTWRVVRSVKWKKIIET